MHKLDTSWLRFARMLAGGALLLPLCGIAADVAMPDARSLGIAESMLKYCNHVDGANSERWRQRVRDVAGGASNASVAKIRTTPQYKAGYSSVSDFVSKVAGQNAKRACAVPVSQDKSSAARNQ